MHFDTVLKFICRVAPAIVRLVQSRWWQSDIHQYHSQWGSTGWSEIHSVCQGQQWLDVS